MAHLNTDYESFEIYLRNFADAYYSVDLSELNGSGAEGTAILAVDTDERTVNISISAENLTPKFGHAQHIHGLFDGSGNPVDSTTPTLADDADGDGFVEVLEGVPSYGDVILSLDDADDMFPLTKRNGDLDFIQSYSLDDSSEFVSPVTGTEYVGDDILPAQLRELVIHGTVVPDGAGAGTDGEVDGGRNGYLPILPTAAGEFVETDLEGALALLAQHQDNAGRMVMGSDGDDRMRGGNGDDVIESDDGNDLVRGRGGDDMIDAGTGDDSVWADAGDDNVSGGDGDDALIGADGDDSLFGDDGEDQLFGRGGDDLLVGGADADRIAGGEGDDIIGGGGGNDIVKGGAGADEIHFDAGTGVDRILDFVIGEDVISFLDGGAVEFANSMEDDVRGDSDLSALDFAERAAIGDLVAGDDQKVVLLNEGASRGELLKGTSADALEAYVVGYNETSGRGAILYDDDWSTKSGREAIAEITSLDTLAMVQSLGVTDFDVY